MNKAFNWTLETEEESKKKRQTVSHQNEFLKEFHNELGNDMAQLIDMSSWKEDIEILNRVVKWLGFENCAFDTFVHENNGGYNHDSSSEIHLGEKCHLVG